MYDNIDDFKKFLEKYKVFRELPEQYKSTKFCKLYFKIYEYMLSIPKEKIVISHIVRNYAISEYINYLFSYIYKFIEAKDFYKWRNRIYSLITKKLGSDSYERFELLYGSKAKKFFDISISKNLNHNKKTLEKKYGKGITNIFQTKECKEKCKAKHIENLGVDNPMKSKIIQNKAKETLLKRYNVLSPFELSDNINFHSKDADEFCKYIDKLLGNPSSSMYAIKNREFFLRTNDKYYFYDYTNTKYKYIIEYHGMYWHGLKEGQVDVKGTPVKEIWAKDKEKRILAEKNGYKVFYVYEDEYKSNKSKCLENLLKEIENYVHSLKNVI